jgi:hypothetical protein
VGRSIVPARAFFQAASEQQGERDDAGSRPGAGETRAAVLPELRAPTVQCRILP